MMMIKMIIKGAGGKAKHSNTEELERRWGGGYREQASLFLRDYQRHGLCR